MIKKISILGCGWLGSPLGESLVKDGYKVRGSVTQKEKLSTLESLGIEAFQIIVGDHSLSENEIKSFLASNVLIITLPFKRSFEEPIYYLNQIKEVAEKVKKSTIRQIIFTSSTSIYPDSHGRCDEEIAFTPQSERSKVLYDTEEHLLNTFEHCVILRLGGLYGGERVIGKFLQNKKNIPQGKAPTNLVHLDDCIALIKKIITSDVKRGIFNLVTDKHPTKRDLYTQAAKKRGYKLPQFKDDQSGKLIPNERLKKMFDYTFLHPDPILDI